MFFNVDNAREKNRSTAIENREPDTIVDVSYSNGQCKNNSLSCFFSPNLILQFFFSCIGNDHSARRNRTGGATSSQLRENCQSELDVYVSKRNDQRN